MAEVASVSILETVERVVAQIGCRSPCVLQHLRIMPAVVEITVYFLAAHEGTAKITIPREIIENPAIWA